MVFGLGFRVLGLGFGVQGLFVLFACFCVFSSACKTQSLRVAFVSFVFLYSCCCVVSCSCFVCLEVFVFFALVVFVSLISCFSEWSAGPTAEEV